MTISGGETFPSDGTTPLVADLSQRALSVSRLAREQYDAEIEQYGADLHFFGKQDDAETHANTVDLREQSQHAHLITSSLYSNVSALMPETLARECRCLAIGRTILSFSHQTIKELLPGMTTTTNFVDWLRGAGCDPLESVLRWNAAACTILRYSADILQITSLQLSNYLDPSSAALVREDVTEKRSVELTIADTPPGIDMLVELLEDPQTHYPEIPPQLVERIIETYAAWRATARSCLGATDKTIKLIDIYKLAETKTAQKPKPHQPEILLGPEAIQDYQKNLAATIADHNEASQPYHPTWSQIKADLKPFSNELLRQIRKEKHPLQFPENANKRITGLLRVLERFGAPNADAAAVSKDMQALFVREHEAQIDVTVYTEILRQADIKADLSKWHPVTEDIEAIHKQWASIEPILQKSWVPEQGTKEEAIAAIANAIACYYKSKLIFERNLVKQQIEFGADDSNMDPNFQKRASVMRHFIRRADEQRQPADDEQCGTPTWPQSSETSDFYYCVTFRDAKNQQWALLEMLTGTEASFVIPMQEIAACGTLDEFVEVFDQTMQHHFQSYQVTHTTDETADDHIARILARTTEEYSK